MGSISWLRSLEEEHLSNLERDFTRRAARNLVIVLGGLILAVYVGSGFFLHFDPSLYGYAVATLVAVAGYTLRLTAWMMRPATRRLMWRYFQLMWLRAPAGQGKQVVIKGVARRREGERPHPAGLVAAELERVRRRAARSKATARMTAPAGRPGEARGLLPPGVLVAFATWVENILLNRFIFRRGAWRGWQHVLLMWGVGGSFLITIPLVFGWIYFEAVAQDRYRLFALGIPVVEMPVRGVLSALVFHALSIFSIMTLAGVLMAIYRRVWFRDAAVDQRLEYDLFPLYLLLAVTVTGLAMSVSHNWFDGQGYPLISAMHQITVVFLLLYLPFGKLFHIPMRPLAAAVEVYHEVAGRLGVQACARCGKAYASAMQIGDVKAILAETGLVPLGPDGRTHTSEYCPECRRVLRGLLYTRRLPWQLTPVAVRPQEAPPERKQEVLHAAPYEPSQQVPDALAGLPVNGTGEIAGIGAERGKEGDHA